MTLTSAARILSNSGGKITATTLTGSSHGTVTLSAANAIADLGAFTTANNAFQLTDAHGLTLTGVVNAGTGNLALTTTGSGHNLVIDQALTGHTVTLTSAARILSNSGGQITATTLTGSSHGTVTLSAANAIADLGAFTTANNAFHLTDAHGLTLTGVVDTGTGNLALTTTGSGHNLVIDQALTGHTVTLTSAAQILSNSGGKITATTLTGSSHGTVTLSAANAIADLGAFTTANNAFHLTDAHGLTLTGAVDTGTANLALTTTGSRHNLVIDQVLTGHTVTLISAAKVNETTAGAIVADKLNVSAQTGITLTSPSNDITTLGTDTTTSGPNRVHL